MASTPKGISASRGAAVLGLSQYQTPLGVWLEIQEERRPGFCKEHGYDPPVDEENEPMKWGTAFEDQVIDLAKRAREHWIEGLEEYHEYNEYITCHIDGRYHPHVETRNLHEGKTTNEFTFRNKWGEPGSDLIPTEYQIQVQHQMLCTDYDLVVVSVLVFPKVVDNWADAKIIPSELLAAKWAPILFEMGYFHQYFVKSNQKVRELLIEKYNHFWETYIIGETEPPPKTEDDIKILCPEPKGTIVATSGVERLAAEHKAINAEIHRTDKRKEQIKTMILKYMHNQAEAPIDNDSVEKWILRSRDGKKLFSYNGKTFR